MIICEEKGITYFICNEHEIIVRNDLNGYEIYNEFGIGVTRTFLTTHKLKISIEKIQWLSNAEKKEIKQRASKAFKKSCKVLDKKIATVKYEKLEIGDMYCLKKINKHGFIISKEIILNTIELLERLNSIKDIYNFDIDTEIIEKKFQNKYSY